MPPTWRSRGTRTWRRFRDVLRAVLSARRTRGPLLSVFREMPARDRRRHVDLVIEWILDGLFTTGD